MKNVINFLIFIIYSTVIFFLPNNKFIFILVIINFVLMFLSKKNVKKLLNSTVGFLPFIIFTFLINCILDEAINAFWIAVKLIIVCNITVIYSSNISIMRNCRSNRNVM